MAERAEDCWPDLVAAALMGGQSLQPKALPSDLGWLSEAGFLAALAAMTPYRFAGRTGAQGAVALPPMADEDEPECSPRAGALLAEILAERGELFEEWCALAVVAGVRPPPELLPRLLDRMTDHPSALMGTRGAWLRAAMGQDPVPVAAETRWADGDLGMRGRALEEMRRRDPAAARAALEAVWKQENAEARVRFLEALDIGLSPEDEPFLEEALDNRSGKVRAAAAERLVYLPESRYALRMAERARALVVLEEKRGGLLRRPGWSLRVTLPDSDAALVRDGLAEGSAGRAAGTAGGEQGRRGRLLHDIVSLAPLSTWQPQDPGLWVAQALDSEWSRELCEGWLAAARREKDKAWSAALVQGLLAAAPRGDTSDWVKSAACVALHLLDAGQVEGTLLSLLPSGKDDWILRLVRDHEQPWSVAFTSAFLTYLAKALSVPADRPYKLYIAKRMAFFAAPESAGEVERLAGALPEELRGDLEVLAATLRFRAEMRRELAP